VQVIVRIPAQLRSLTNGLGEVKVEFEGDLGTAFEQLLIEFPGLRERIMDDSGGLRRFINVFLADEDIRFLDGLNTKVTDGQVVSIVPAVAGG
jgi:molybdopterin synthase sulfur carrier subunit